MSILEKAIRINNETLTNKEIQFGRRLLSWFSTNGRDFPWRHETDPYKILVTEKLLQQTTYGHVLKVYNTFFDRFPNIQSLACAKISDIELVIRRLGFQRQRARQFKEIGRAILKRFNGEIPANKKELLSLIGVGEYVANAVLCFAFDEAVSVVDINVRRVVGRYFGWTDIKDEEIAKRLLRLVPEGEPKRFNWSIIDFSSLICSRKPKCKICFLNDLCSFFKTTNK